MKNLFLLLLFSISAIPIHSQNFWQEVHSGNFHSFDPYTLPSLEVSAEGNVFAIADSFLIRSVDNGLSWQNIYAVPFSFSYASVLGTSSTGVIYLNSDSLRKSTDEGNSWITTSHPHFFTMLWFLITNDDGDVFTETGVLSGSYSFRSTDEGSSWNQIGIPEALLQSISFHPNENTYAIFNGNLPPGQSCLYKSSNKGNAWENISGVPSSSIVYVAKNGNIFLGNYSTLLRSIDDGLTWDISLNQEIKDIAENQLGHLFITTNGSGVFKSTDNGMTWQQINSGLSFYLSPTKLIVDSLGYLYVITGTDHSSQTKLFRSVDSTIPVELISFTASNQGTGVILNWTTASETNNQGFEVERRVHSLPAGQAGPQSSVGNWSSVGYIEGNGTTTEPKTYSFVDENLMTGLYSYRLKQMDYDGSYAYSNEIEVEVNFTPTEYALYQNYPNPFNPSTKISWQSPVSGRQTIKVYDVLGSEVATLVDEFREAGSYEVEFNTIGISSGVYFYKLQAGEFTSSKKMILSK